MDYPTIRALLDKYWEGETTLEEEGQLRTYFNQPQGYDARLDAEAVWFVYTKDQAAQSSQRPLPLMQVVHRRTHRWLGWVVAASIVLVVGLGWWKNQQQQPTPPAIVAAQSLDTYDDPQAAYEATKAALKRLSKGLKKGMKTTRKELRNMPKLDGE